MLPRTTSTWSTCASGTSSHGAEPKSARDSGAPSTSTSTWFELAPRTNTLACAPSRPVWATLKLTNWRSRSGTSTADEAAMSAAVITVVFGKVSGSFCGTRAAVTTTSCPDGSLADCAAAVPAASSGSAEAMMERANAATRPCMGASGPVWREIMGALRIVKRGASVPAGTTERSSPLARGRPRAVGRYPGWRRGSLSGPSHALSRAHSDHGTTADVRALAGSDTLRDRCGGSSGRVGVSEKATVLIPV